MRSPFVGGFAVRHRTNDGHFIRDLGDVFEVLAELDSLDGGVDSAEGATIFRGSIGLWIPGFLMSQTPGKEDLDNRFRYPFTGFVVLLLGVGLHTQKLREGQSEASKEADVKEAAS